MNPRRLPPVRPGNFGAPPAVGFFGSNPSNHIVRIGGRMAFLSTHVGARSSPDLASFLRAHRLPAAFYRRDAAEVARDLLGAILVRRESDGVTAGFIVEDEAYYGGADPASHAFRGRTTRNAPMFGAGGHAYVYFVYGNHFMLNVVTGTAGDPSAVLLRAVEPAAGFARMGRRRGGVTDRQLTNGPGRLARAFGIGRAHNGMPLTGDDLFISAPFRLRAAMARSGRIGVARSGDTPLRFYLPDSPFVSGRA